MRATTMKVTNRASLRQHFIAPPWDAGIARRPPVAASRPIATPKNYTLRQYRSCFLLRHARRSCFYFESPREPSRRPTQVSQGFRSCMPPHLYLAHRSQLLLMQGCDERVVPNFPPWAAHPARLPAPLSIDHTTIHHGHQHGTSGIHRYPHDKQSSLEAHMLFLSACSRVDALRKPRTTPPPCRQWDMVSRDDASTASERCGDAGASPFQSLQSLKLLVTSVTNTGIAIRRAGSIIERTLAYCKDVWFNGCPPVPVKARLHRLASEHM